MALASAEHRGRLYNRKLLPQALWRGVLDGQREQIFRLFTERFPPAPEQRVANIGVNGDLEQASQYFFESRYPFLQQVTACGLEEADRFEALFPDARYVQVERGAPLPFSDGAFDLVFCNAVIEHVGSRARQREFLGEVLRLAPRAFVTTPNRWFPVELHTLLPVLHYLPAQAYRRVYRALGFDFFSREENLNLMARHDLETMIPDHLRPYTTILEHRFLGFTSNLIVVVDRSQAASSA